MFGLMRAARAFFLLALLAFAGNTFAAKTYSDNGDGTVTDPTTGLTWMRCSMGQMWDGTTCTGTASTYTWDQANALTGVVTFAGLSDWRLPSLDELRSLIDYTQATSPATNQTLFPASPIFGFWSGSRYASNSYFAWGVSSGGASNGLRSSSIEARLVRGGQSFSTFVLTVSKNGVGAVSSALAGIVCGNTCSGSYTWTLLPRR